jgi:hypothetical protein
MSIYEINSFRGAISDYEDKGIPGAFKMGKNLDVRKRIDSLSAGQALTDEGLSGSPSASVSPSASQSPSASPSATASPSASASPSGSPSSSASPSTGISPSPSASPSASSSPSSSASPSSSGSPSPSPSAGLSTVFSDLILTFVRATDGYTYGFGDTGVIYRRDADGGTVRVYKDPDGKIKGASQWYIDDGTKWLYWATDTLLKRKELPGLNDWNDVETVGNLVSAEWHTITQVGGALAIANSRFIAYVGYDASYTQEATDLIPGNVAKTIIERNGRAIIGTVKASDTTSGVNGAVDTEIPLAQVGDNGEIFYANMSDSIPVNRFPGGGQVNPGGVTNLIDQANFFEWEEGASSWIDKHAVGNLALFGVYNADTGYNGVYTYGRKYKNHPFVLNLEHNLEVDEIGAVIDVDGTTVMSYRDGSDYGVKATDSSTKATGTYEGLDFKAPVKRPQNITNWKRVELFFDPLDNGSSIEFWYRVDKTGNWVQAKLVDGTTSFATAGKKKAVFFINADGQIFEPRVVTNPFGNLTPEIHRIRVYFN